MGVTIDTVHRLVRRIANQCPTRYYLDPMGDGSYSHVDIELWLPVSEEFPARLNAELEREGFVFSWRTQRGEHSVCGWRADRARFAGEGRGE